MRPDKPLSAIEFSIYRHYRIVHGVRIALGFVLTFLLVRLCDIPEGSWPLITPVVVMGPISSSGQRFSARATTHRRHRFRLDFRADRPEAGADFTAAHAGPVYAGDVYLRLSDAWQAPLYGAADRYYAGGGMRRAGGDMNTALWRGGDVILGSLLALLFTSIWPQKPISTGASNSPTLSSLAKIYHAGFSPNTVEKPRLDKPLRRLLTDVVRMRALLEPASKETRIPKSVLEGIQTTNRNILCTLELQINAGGRRAPAI